MEMVYSVVASRRLWYTYIFAHMHLIQVYVLSGPVLYCMFNEIVISFGNGVPFSPVT